MRREPKIIAGAAMIAAVGMFTAAGFKPTKPLHPHKTSTTVAASTTEATTTVPITSTTTIPTTSSSSTSSPSTTIPTGEIYWQANASSTPDVEWSAWSDDHVTSGEPSSPGALYPGWTHPNMGIDSRVGVVLPGKPSYRVYAPVGETRHEFKQGNPIRYPDRIFYDGDDTWIAWATLLTEHTTATSWEVFNQFRHINETGLTTSGSPHALGASPDTGTNYNWSDDPNLYPGATWAYDLGVPIQVGVPVRWTVHIVWSADPAIGLIEVYADGVQRMSRHQATLLFNSTTGQPGRAAFRAGNYRDSVLATNPVEIHFAGITVASTRTAAEIGAFG